MANNIGSLIELADWIEGAPIRWLPAAGHVKSFTLTLDETDQVASALRLSAQQREPGGWRVTDWDQARAAGRILLVWKAFGGVKEHIELGRYKSSAAAWVNTYGHPFSGDPDGWAPLLPFDGPSEAIADVSVDELAAARAVLDRVASSGRR